MTIPLIQEINRTSYEPAYVQLVNILQTLMATGVFKPGAQLPLEVGSEAQRTSEPAPQLREDGPSGRQVRFKIPEQPVDAL